ncbi:hypothetical protein ACFXPR_15180 [Nocardia tengchongensis]|uniref:hypothetical protein n=1 Tax=Nocardia tengchongensis TaxID=2055889 RepID=UPI0036CE3D29
MSSFTGAQRRRIGFLPFDGVKLLDFAGPVGGSSRAEISRNQRMDHRHDRA